MKGWIDWSTDVMKGWMKKWNIKKNINRKLNIKRIGKGLLNVTFNENNEWINVCTYV